MPTGVQHQSRVEVRANGIEETKKMSVEGIHWVHHVDIGIAHTVGSEVQKNNTSQDPILLGKWLGEQGFGKAAEDIGLKGKNVKFLLG